jgi:hypothetical protein
MITSPCNDSFCYVCSWLTRKSCLEGTSMDLLNLLQSPRSNSILHFLTWLSDLPLAHMEFRNYCWIQWQMYILWHLRPQLILPKGLLEPPARISEGRFWMALPLPSTCYFGSCILQASKEADPFPTHILDGATSLDVQCWKQHIWKQRHGKPAEVAVVKLTSTVLNLVACKMRLSPLDHIFQRFMNRVFKGSAPWHLLPFQPQRTSHLGCWIIIAGL